ncbi:MAG: hypothetical protein GTO14_08250 [Anaerolineales bacterium]|nr:hypothetical protein [Anaerolineales bacterium]
METRYSTQMLIISSIILAVIVWFVIESGASWLACLIGTIVGLLLARYYLREYITAITDLGWIRPPSDLTEQELLIGAIAEAEGRYRGAKAGVVGAILAFIAMLVLSRNEMDSLVAGCGFFAASILIYYALHARRLENMYWKA